MSDDNHISLVSTEEVIADIWESILGQRPSPSCNFFEIGGDSLLAAKLASQIKRQLNKKARLMLIFENRMFSDYARAVHESADITGPARREGVLL